MNTLGFARLRDDQMRGPEQENSRPLRHPAALYAYPVDKPFKLTLGGVGTLQDCPVPISLYRAVSLDGIDTPIIVERYFAGAVGYLYPIRLKTVAYDQPVQTFANLPGMNALFSVISPPGKLQTIQVKDPVYVLQDQAFDYPIIPQTDARLCPDGLSSEVAYLRMEAVLRLKSRSDMQRLRPQMSLHVELAIAETLARISPKISLRGSRRWGDLHAKMSAVGAIARMSYGHHSQTCQHLKTNQANLLAYSPSAAASVAEVIDSLPLTDFSLTIHYEERTPLQKTWNSAGDRYWLHLVRGNVNDHQANLRRTLIDDRMTDLALQATAIVPTLLEDQSLYIGGLTDACLAWINDRDFLHSPYAVTIDKTHFGEARITYCPTDHDGELLHEAAFSVHLDLPFMALACPSLVVERV